MLECKVRLTLELLSKFDQEMSLLNTTIEETKARLLNNQQKISVAQEKINILEQEGHAQRKSSHAHHLQLQDIKDKEAHKRQQLDNVSNQKEYKALEKEIEILTRKRIDIDERAMKEWFSLEESHKKSQSEMTNLSSSIAQLTQENQKLQELLDQTHAAATTKEEERQKNIAQIPLEWKTRYEQMKKSVQDPIVAVINTSCSACYYSILKQDLAKLKNADILPCRNCYRLLYIETPSTIESSY